MAVTILRRKALRNQTRSTNRLNKIKDLMRKPEVRNVDVDAIKAEFAEMKKQREADEKKAAKPEVSDKAGTPDRAKPQSRDTEPDKASEEKKDEAKPVESKKAEATEEKKAKAEATEAETVVEPKAAAKAEENKKEAAEKQ